MLELPGLVLKKNEERRLRAGHVWIFSNEVDTQKTPLSEFEPGEPVAIVSHSGKHLGNAYVNPHSLICARLVSRRTDYILDKSLLVHRLKIALALRQRLFTGPWYRLVFGESDGLPGLVVDRYDSVLVVQITTAGMERLKQDIVTALLQVLKPEAIMLRNDTSSRLLEGLQQYTEVAFGELPEEVILTENDSRFAVPLLTGQKTGWFFDQRMNRARLARYVNGARVLDVFSYSGSWGIQAALHGADSVICVDDSEKAVELVRHNAALNTLSDRVSAIKADGFEILKQLRAEEQHFDVIVLDPPAFIKRKKDLKKGREAYTRLNQLAMRLLSKDGILITSSCSYHLQRSDMQRLLLKGAVHIDREMMILEQGQQGPDHPIHPAIPETGYLKSFFLRLLPR